MIFYELTLNGVIMTVLGDTRNEHGQRGREGMEEKKEKMKKREKISASFLSICFPSFTERGRSSSTGGGNTPLYVCLVPRVFVCVCVPGRAVKIIYGAISLAVSFSANDIR